MQIQAIGQGVWVCVCFSGIIKESLEMKSWVVVQRKGPLSGRRGSPLRWVQRRKRVDGEEVGRFQEEALEISKSAIQGLDERAG